MNAGDAGIYPIAWFFLIGFGLTLYIILDGFSLGLGILFPLFTGQEKQRSIMLTTVSPIWDSNQTWLVLTAAGLYGVFPLVYSILLPAMYLPLILMLVCLFFRGMVFELRFKAQPRSRKWFDLGFSFTTIITAFIQGMIVGSVISGINVVNGRYAGGGLDWFTWFGVCAGVVLVVGYALLGAAWLIMKTEDPLQQHCYRIIKPLMLLFIAGMIAVVIWTPLVNDNIAIRWTSFPDILWLGVIAVLILLLVYSVLSSVSKRHETLIFAGIIGVFLLGLFGLVISLYPVMLPPDITIWNAAAHRSSLTFALVGFAIMLPIILAYSTYSFWTFRGKVRESEG